MVSGAEIMSLLNLLQSIMLIENGNSHNSVAAISDNIMIITDLI